MITPFDEDPAPAPGAVDPVHEALLGAASRLRALAASHEAAAQHLITALADGPAVAVKHSHMMLAFRLAAAEVETLARVHELESKA